MSEEANAAIKSFSRFIALVLVAVFLAAVGWLAFESMRYIANHWSSLDKTDAMLALLVIPTFLLGCRILANGSVRAMAIQVQQDGRHKRQDIYFQLAETWIHNSLQWDSVYKDDNLRKAERQLALYGAPQVLLQYFEFRQHALAVGHADKSRFGELLNAMRTDLGKRAVKTPEMLIELTMSQRFH